MNFNVAWPAGGMFDAATINGVEEIVPCPHNGHPYIVTWRGLIDRIGSSLPWIVQLLVSQQTQVLAAKTSVPSAGTKENRTKPATVFRGETEESEIFPPPYFPSAEHPTTPIEEAHPPSCQAQREERD